MTPLEVIDTAVKVGLTVPIRKLRSTHLIATLFAVLISITPVCANADYGQSAITFECNQREDGLILSLYILWNQDLDSFR